MTKSKIKIWNHLAEGSSLTGLILIVCTILSFILSNFILKQNYINFWTTKIGTFTLLNVINDGLMTIFFLVVGMEIKKELLTGELSNYKKALLPIICALGGMIIPALIYTMLNFGTSNIRGWAIPTATDIAFSIGILSLLGNRIPNGLKIFLTALAIIDDLGAVVVIALFYSTGISFINLSIALGLALLLWGLLKVFNLYSTFLWVVVGCAIWYFLHHSGIHATITGVILAAILPASYQNDSPLTRWAECLRGTTNWFIIPLFAMANTAIIINSNVMSSLTSSTSLGIILGLFFGKPLGIMGFAYLSVITGLTELPKQVNWQLLFGAAILAGIGFTMSLFVSFLAFEDEYRKDVAKIAILIGSSFASIVGLLYLNVMCDRREDSKNANHTS